MKKIAVLFISLLISVSAFSDTHTLVYAGLIRAKNYQMSSQSNTFVTKLYRAYLVVSYDTDTRVFSEATMIKYWADKGLKWTETSSYTGTITENVINSPVGDRVFMQLFQDGVDNKSYEFNDSPSSMIPFRVSYEAGGVLTVVEFFASSSITGSLITESTDALGQRLLQSADVAFGISQGITARHLSETVADTVDDVEAIVARKGYSPVP